MIVVCRCVLSGVGGGLILVLAACAGGATQATGVGGQQATAASSLRVTHYVGGLDVCNRLPPGEHVTTRAIRDITGAATGPKYGCSVYHLSRPTPTRFIPTDRGLRSGDRASPGRGTRSTGPITRGVGMHHGSVSKTKLPTLVQNKDAENNMTIDERSYGLVRKDRE